jgi:putative addiction module component (TIGR02574 family)
MPMTLEQIVAEASRLPTEQVLELVDRLSQKVHSAPGIDESWKGEIRRRVADIENGKVEGIPGAQVAARIRKIVGR